MDFMKSNGFQNGKMDLNAPLNEEIEKQGSADISHGTHYLSSSDYPQLLCIFSFI